MIARFALAAAGLAAAVVATPAAAVVLTFNFANTQTPGNVTSIARTSNGVTATATAKIFQVQPGSLTSLAGMTDGSIRRTRPGIGVAGAASNDQLDTNFTATREGILLTLNDSVSITGMRLSFVDADDTLALYGVGPNGAFTYLGFNGVIRTGLAGATSSNTFIDAAQDAGDTNIFTLSSPTAYFNRFFFTTRLGGNVSDPGYTGGQGYRIDSITAFVPEPGTWAMLVLGFGLVGVTARRRRPTSVIA